MKPFFLCWREGDRNPMVKHDTPDEAEQEAYRLVVKENCPVHVLERRATCFPDIRARWEYPIQIINKLCPHCGHHNCKCPDKGLMPSI